MSQKRSGVLLFVLTIFTLSFQGPRLSQAKSKSAEGEPIPFNLKQSDSGEKPSKKNLRESVERLLFEATNEVREKKKLGTLSENPTLLKAGRYHSEDMMKRNYFSHFSPEGKSVLDRIRKFKSGYDESCAENLHNIYSGKGLSDPQAIADLMIKDWMGSPDHRKNILGKDYTLMSVGCATDGFKIFCTQVFSGPHI